MSHTVADVLRKFGETTLVRGIPRALKSQDRGLLILWTGAVCVCAAFLLWQISATFLRYSKYDHVTVIEEPDIPAVFPDITICKVYQMNSLYSPSVSWKSYINNTIASYNRWPLARVQAKISNITELLYNLAWKTLLSKEGYMASLPLNVTEMESEETARNPFVIYCSLTGWNTVIVKNCLEFVKPIWHPMYYRCHTIQVSQLMNQDMSALTAVLYLDDFNQPANLDACCPNAFRSQSSGVRVAIHDSGTTPDMERGIAVSPGTETTILLSEIDRYRLSEPYGNCVDTNYIGVKDNLGYSSKLCEEICYQNKAVEICRCIDRQNFFTASQLHAANYTVCGNQTSRPANAEEDNDLSGLRGLLCLRSVANFNQTDCIKSCLPSCFERQYMPSVTSSGPWPHPALQMDFYLRFIRKSDFAQRFEPFKDIATSFINGSISSTEMVNRIRLLDLIPRHFIQINVIMSERHPYVLKDSPAMTVDGLLSSVGGSLSLWLGMTIMFAFEILELIYVIFMKWFHAQEQQTPPRNNDPHTTTSTSSSFM